MTDSLILVAFLIAIVFLSGALLAATPWFMKKNECFAVTIPESAQADVRFLAFRKRYAVAVLAVTLICAFALAIVSSVPLGKMGSAASAGCIVCPDASLSQKSRGHQEGGGLESRAR